MAQEIKMSAAGLKAMQEELEYLKLSLIHI